MSSQSENLETYEPQTVAQAEQMVLHLQDEITAIQNQLSDPQRRDSTDTEDYNDWRQRAEMAKRHKKSAVRHLSVWIRQKRQEAKENDTSFHHMTIGRALKLGAKQYGRLIEVLIAAENYIDSPSEDQDEALIEELAAKVARAREIVRTDIEALRD